MDAGGGLFEVVPTGETGGDADLILGEVALMAEVAKATGLPLSFLLVQARDAPDLWRKQLALVEKARADGANLTPQVAARPGGMLLGSRQLPRPDAPPDLPGAGGFAAARRARQGAAEA